MAMLPYPKPRHSSRRILSFGILVILAYVFAPRALASTECKTLRTAGAQQWFPYAFNEFEGRLKATGIAFDVLTLLSQDLGVTLKIETGLPWKRIESKLDAGELDILAGNYWNETRSRKWLITAPFATDEVYVVLSPSLVQTRGTEISLSALTQYIGVMPRGISLGEKFDSIKSNLKIIEVKDHDKMYEMIRRHRADYAVSPQSAAQSHLDAPENDGMQLSQAPISSNNVHFAISAKSKCASLFPEFNDALSARLKDGSIEQIINTYNLTH
ncbi:transporter substrate-binding domain-containing protein [Alteromonas sp. ALT199]|nr:transporter substrate-binding domain-containing protein [Alteromonas sp. ALT199]